LAVGGRTHTNEPTTDILQYCCSSYINSSWRLIEHCSGYALISDLPNTKRRSLRSIRPLLRYSTNPALFRGASLQLATSGEFKVHSRRTFEGLVLKLNVRYRHTHGDIGRHVHCRRSGHWRRGFSHRPRRGGIRGLTERNTKQFSSD
jgi:hypothetical protein